MRSSLSLLSLCLLLALPAHAQRRADANRATPAPATPAPAPAVAPASASATFAQPKAVYELAIKYRDPSVAIVAIYDQLAQNPSDAALKDSLASLYFINRNYIQALAVAREILVNDGQNAKMLQLVAISEQNLGRNKEALEAYEKLYAVSRNSQHLYQVAVLQYSLQRVGECMSSLAQVIQSTEANDEKVVVALNQQQAQEVPLKAAAWNVRGVVLREQKELANAKMSFQESLKLFPDFVLAKNNLEDLEASQKPAAAKPGAAKPAPRPAGR